MAEQSYSGVCTAPRLKHWDEILLRWCAIVEQHCRIAGPGDVPWWNNEVANAGLVAAAAIQCGYPALVESPSKKGGSSGRLDLWVQFGMQKQGTHTEEECVEFKVANHDSSSRECDCQKHLYNAVNDARKITTSCRNKIGACVYKVIYEPDSKTTDEDLARTQQQIRDNCPHDALAWAFPTCVRNVPEKGGWIVPGIVLAMKCV